MKLRVVYPGNVEPGAMVVGIYAPNAPTRPVQEMAWGLRVQRVEDMRNGADIKYGVRLIWDGGQASAPFAYSSDERLLVIES